MGGEDVNAVMSQQGERNTDEFFLKMHKEVVEMAKLTVEDVPSHLRVPFKDLLSLCEAQGRSLEHARSNFKTVTTLIEDEHHHRVIRASASFKGLREALMRGQYEG